LAAKQAEQLMNISLKARVPPERTAATIILQDYEDIMAFESLEKHSRDHPRYKRIFDIMNEITNKAYDGTNNRWKMEIKTQYKDLFEQLNKKKDWFRNNYGEQE